MYIAKKQRKNKHGEVVYYFYAAESQRVDGKVKNTQKYMFSFNEMDMECKDKTDEKLNSLLGKFDEEEIELVSMKINEILAEKAEQLE